MSRSHKQKRSELLDASINDVLWKTHLTGTNIPRRLVSVRDADSIERAVNLMSTNDVLSLPVLAEDGTNVGFVDVEDFAAYLWKEIQSTHAQTSEFGLENGNAVGGRGPVSTPRRILAEEKVLDIVNTSRKDPLLIVHLSDPIENVLRRMIDTRARRVSVETHQGEFVTILSQLDIVRWFYENAGDTCVRLDETMEAVGVGMNRVVTVLSTVSVLETLRVLTENKFSAVGVVDRTGRLINRFSTSDLRSLTADTLDDVYLSVTDYLQKYEISHFNTISSTCTLRAALKVMTQVGFHRFFVVNGSQHAVGVLTLGDFVMEAAYYSE